MADQEVVKVRALRKHVCARLPRNRQRSPVPSIFLKFRTLQGDLLTKYYCLPPRDLGSNPIIPRYDLSSLLALIQIRYHLHLLLAALGLQVCYLLLT